MCRVLLVYRSLIPSVRLCGYEQLSYLQHCGKIEFMHASFSGLKRKHLNWADTVVFVRGDTQYEHTLARWLNGAGKRTVYVLDDDLLNVPDSFSCATHYGKAKTNYSIRGLLRECKVFVSPSPVLIAKYGKQDGENFQISEPAIGVGIPPSTRKANTVVRIGFAGSFDRADDLDNILSGAIKRVVKDYPQKVQFEFIGARPAIVNELELQHYTYEDSYQAYQTKMRSLCWDIGLAPMPATDFHRCKHYNKLVEYASFGIVGIYSDVEPYNQGVTQGETGLLCKNSEQAWYEAMIYLIHNQQHLAKMKKQVNTLATTTFSIATCAEQFLPIVSWQSASDKFPLFFLEFLKLCNFFSRAYDFVLRNKWNTPLAAYSKLLERHSK